MMKRMIALSLTLLLAVSVFAGCSSPGDSQQPGDSPAVTPPETTKTTEPGEKVTISYLSRWKNPADPKSVYYMERLEEFRRQNPDIIVEDISMGDDSEAHRVKIYSGVASGDLPDLFVCSLAFPLREWAENGIISDLTPLVQASDWTGPANEMLEMFTFSDGKTYGVPQQLVTAGVFVNTKLLGELNLAVPETWEDVQALVAPLKAAGVTPFGLAAQSVNEVDRFVNLLSTRMYGFEFRDKMESGEWKWTDPEPLALLEQLKKFIDEGVLDADSVSLSAQAGLLPMFEQGQVAMMLAASWNFALIGSMEFAEDIKCVSFPYFEAKPEYKDIWLGAKNEGFVCTSKPGTPEYEASCKLLSFMLGQESFQGVAETMGGGASPVEIDLTKVSANPVVSSFMEAFSKRTGIVDDYTAYISNNKIPLLQPTNTEIQALFGGRSAQDVAQTLADLYAENRG